MRLRLAIASVVLIVGTVTVATVAAGSSVDLVRQAPILNPVAEPVSPAAAQELKALGPGAQVVECAPGITSGPVGMTLSKTPDFMQTHPGFTELSDGHCAMDTSKTVVPMTPVSVDPK